jgi:hypothetical protein
MSNASKWTEFSHIHNRLCTVFGERQDVTEMYFRKEFTLPGASQPSAVVYVSGQTFDADEDVFSVRVEWCASGNCNGALALAHLGQLTAATHLQLQVEAIVSWFRISDAERDAFHATYKPARSLYLQARAAERGSDSKAS